MVRSATWLYKTERLVLHLLSVSCCPNSCWFFMSTLSLCLQNTVEFLFLMTFNRYQVSMKEFHSNYGGSLLMLSNIPTLVQSAFPNFEFLPWLFHRMPDGVFDNLTTQRKYIAWLKDQVGVSNDSDLLSEHFAKHKGQRLLARYQYSPKKALLSLSLLKERESDDEALNHSQPATLMKSRPRRFWV
jgi:hypothetical protein